MNAGELEDAPHGAVGREGEPQLHLARASSLMSRQEVADAPPGRRQIVGAVGQISVDGPGAIGSAAVQLLRSPGACVTAVCATENVELVQGLDAGRGIDYTAGNFTSPVCRPDRARTYEVCNRRR